MGAYVKPTRHAATWLLFVAVDSCVDVLMCTSEWEEFFRSSLQPSPLGKPAVVHYLGQEKKKQENQSVIPSVCPPVRLSVRPSVHLAARPSISPGAVPQSACPSVRRRVRRPVRLSVGHFLVPR